MIIIKKSIYPVFILLFLISCSHNEGIDIIEPVTYGVIFESNGGTTVNSQDIQSGSKVTKPTPPVKLGSTFIDWYKESTLTTIFNFSTETISSNTTLYAKWDEIEYTVTFESNGGSVVNEQNIVHGDNVVEPAKPTKSGYSFINWYKENTFTTVFDFNNELVDSHITLYADWSKSYNVVFDLNGGTGIEINEQIIEEGFTADEPTSSANLYCLRFNGWHTNKDIDSPFDFTNGISEDLVLYARYTSSSFVHNPNTKAELQNLVDNIVDLSTINTCAINDMSNLFEGKNTVTDFNGSLSNWDVSNVTTMNSMFYNASEFNQNINTWDVSKVTDMVSMFQGATLFNQPLDNWNVSNVTKLTVMFRFAESFNQNINSWNVSNVVKTAGLFQGASAFNQPLDNWDLSKVTNMDSMFVSASEFNQDISSWNVSNVTTMDNMFNYALKFNQAIGTWDVSNVTNFTAMFRGAEEFNQDISLWNISSANVTSSMFSGASLFNQDISAWDVSSVTKMRNMFFSASSFNQNLDSWNVSNVTDMNRMFNGANVFNQTGIKIWNIQQTTDIEKMLSNTAFSTTFRFDNLPDTDPF